jgi:RimJ/RimL family protein N-acetyltransferase
MALPSSHPDRAELRDGRKVLISQLTPADAPVVADAFARLSDESRRLRFLGPKANLTSAELRYLTEVDGHDHEALAAIEPSTGRGIAIGRFVRDPTSPDRAEVAITVADEWQRQGLGKLMLERLVHRAREESVRSFTALVSADNRGMQALLGRVGGSASVHHVSNGVAEYEIKLGARGARRRLEDALRAAAAGQFEMPTRLCEILRGLVPLRTLRH